MTRAMEVEYVEAFGGGGRHEWAQEAQQLGGGGAEGGS
jgi:hypothetical protein